MNGKTMSKTNRNKTNRNNNKNNNLDDTFKHYIGRKHHHETPHLLSKSTNGLEHTFKHHQQKHTLPSSVDVIGNACAEVFCGEAMGKVLLPCVHLQYQVMKQYMDSAHMSRLCSPLFSHTSTGYTTAHTHFLEALTPYIPLSWRQQDDWMLNLQMEGASAIHCAYDVLLQLQTIRLQSNIQQRKKCVVAVGDHSYHGPGSTSFGSRDPFCIKGHNHVQVQFPTPSFHNQKKDEPNDDFHKRCYEEYTAFLNVHGEHIAVLFLEPQWGSSSCAQPWPQHLLHKYIALAKTYNILICADEIMCGVGRHGVGNTLFLTTAWDLDVDAITFGKAIAGGAYALSGALFKTGFKEMKYTNRIPFQSHTYAHGGHVLPLIAATQVLNTLPHYFDHIHQLGCEVCEPLFKRIEHQSNGAVVCNGQGCMWGVSYCVHHTTCSQMDHTKQYNMFASILQKKCAHHKVLPYFVPRGGLMVTPPLDVPKTILQNSLLKVEKALEETIQIFEQYFSKTCGSCD